MVNSKLLHYIVFFLQQQENGALFISAAKVDCSNKNLTVLPEKLPTNTICLNVSNNNVSRCRFKLY